MKMYNLFPNIFYNIKTYKSYQLVSSDGDFVYLIEEGCNTGIHIDVLEFINLYTNNIKEIRKLKIDDILE
jgi:uncharacterized LabA/DUF88 family protein